MDYGGVQRNKGELSGRFHFESELQMRRYTLEAENERLECEFQRALLLSQVQHLDDEDRRLQAAPEACKVGGSRTLVERERREGEKSPWHSCC